MDEEFEVAGACFEIQFGMFGLAKMQVDIGSSLRLSSNKDSQLKSVTTFKWLICKLVLLHLCILRSHSCFWGNRVKTDTNQLQKAHILLLVNGLA